MLQLPTGAVTFLFTDIEGSTRLWESDADAMRLAFIRHDEIARAEIEASGGIVFKTVGDAICAVFHTGPEAAAAALAAQTALFARAVADQAALARVWRSVPAWRASGGATTLVNRSTVSPTPLMPTV